MTKNIRDDYIVDRFPTRKGWLAIMLSFVPVVVYRAILGTDLIGGSYLTLGLIGLFFVAGIFVFMKGNLVGLADVRYIHHSVTQIDKSEFDEGKAKNKLAKQNKQKRNKI